MSYKSKKAFTLIELLVVIAIIGVLATVSIISLSNARAKSRDAKRTADIKQVQTALELFFNDNNRYPTFDEWGAGQLYSTSSSGTSTYMQVIPSAPTPVDGSCTNNQNTINYVPAPNGSSYSLSFCIGSNTGTLASGPKCLTPGGIVDTDCSGNLVTSVVYGTSGSDSGRLAAMDDNYIYVSGNSSSSPAFGIDAALLKYDKNTLALIGSKVYGGSSSEGFVSVLVDGDYIYTIGYTQSEGFGSHDYILYKFDKDLNLITRITIGGTLSDGDFSQLTSDSDHIYFGGSSSTGSSGVADILIMKFNKSDLSIDYQKLYGGPNSDFIAGLVLDGDNLYITGPTSGVYGGYDLLLLKINKNDFTLIDKKVIGSSLDDYSAVGPLISDGDYLYMGGTTKYESVGGTADALIIKIRKSNLSIVSQKMYGGTGIDGSLNLALHGDYLYAVASDASEGQGGTEFMLLKFDKNDLSLLSKKVYGSSSNDSAINFQFSDGYLYTAGSTYNNTIGGVYADFNLLRFKADLPSGAYNTTPSGFVLADSNLTFKDSSLSIQASSLTYKDASVSTQASSLTERVPSWTANGVFIIQ